MTILLVRHGETDGNAQRRLQTPDTPLNARGLRQAQLVAERLAGASAVHVLASDLVRAQMTAEAIVARTGLPLELSPLLVERDFGDLRGQAYAALGSDPFAPDFVPPNGESWDMFHTRVAAAWDAVVRARMRVAGPLIVVTHGLVCRALAQLHLQLDVSQALPDRFGNTSLTIVDAPAPFRVRLLDCTAHLREGEASGPSGGAA